MGALYRRLGIVRMTKLIKAPRNVIKPKAITSKCVKLLFNGMPEIMPSDPLILEEIRRRLEEVSRAHRYLSSDCSKLAKFQNQQKAVVKAARRARPYKAFYDIHFQKILEDLETWEATFRPTRLMIHTGDTSVPIEALFPSSTSAKPQDYLVMRSIHGIWKDLLGQTCTAEPSANLTKFAERVFELLECGDQNKGATRSRWRRYFAGLNK